MGRVFLAGGNCRLQGDRTDGGTRASAAQLAFYVRACVRASAPMTFLRLCVAWNRVSAYRFPRLSRRTRWSRAGLVPEVPCS